jgi:hypothetical protein
VNIILHLYLQVEIKQVLFGMIQERAGLVVLVWSTPSKEHQGSYPAELGKYTQHYYHIFKRKNNCIYFILEIALWPITGRRNDNVKIFSVYTKKCFIFIFIFYYSRFVQGMMKLL